jgi:hypothetical protein
VRSRSDGGGWCREKEEVRSVVGSRDVVPHRADEVGEEDDVPLREADIIRGLVASDGKNWVRRLRQVESGVGF